jgi:bifunctional non-homologous end joining protein LigD
LRSLSLASDPPVVSGKHSAVHLRESNSAVLRLYSVRFHRDGWVYEEKVDGWRMLVYKEGDRVRLVSRNGRDHTRRFRDIVAAVSNLSAGSLVLDGEVAIYDQQLRSRFEWLREPGLTSMPSRAANVHSVRLTAPRRPRTDWASAS